MLTQKCFAQSLTSARAVGSYDTYILSRTKREHSHDWLTHESEFCCFRLRPGSTHLLNSAKRRPGRSILPSTVIPNILRAGIVVDWKGEKSLSGVRWLQIVVNELEAVSLAPKLRYVLTRDEWHKTYLSLRFNIRFSRTSGRFLPD
jgi:hypothetical protein